MNDSKLKALVTEAVELDRQANVLDAKLKGIKALLTAEAKLRADDATKTDGGGTSITLEGLDGCIARITRTGRALKASISPKAKEFGAIRQLCIDHVDKGDGFLSLFDRETEYKLVPDFRSKAELFVGKAAAAKLLKLVTSSGKTTVSFETKKEAAA